MGTIERKIAEIKPEIKRILSAYARNESELEQPIRNELYAALPFDLAVTFRFFDNGDFQAELYQGDRIIIVTTDLSDFKIALKAVLKLSKINNH